MEEKPSGGVADYLSVVERYFQEKYYINEKNIGEDVCLLTHSNKVCIVTIPETHPIRKEQKAVVKVDYKFGDVNRLSNRVTGKGKRGAQSLTPESQLCEITCSDGDKYFIHCGMKGQLLEVNDNLKSSPQLITEKPQTDGYIAIVLPKLKNYEAEMKKLHSKDVYLEKIKNR